MVRKSHGSFTKNGVGLQSSIIGDNPMDEKLLASIGMPVYNEERQIRRALSSLLGLDCSNLELVISDNASTDQTADICKEYCKQDSRVRYYRNDTNIGMIPNFGRVLQLARGM